LRRAASEKRLAGFQELPEKSLFPALRATCAGSFTHRIVNDRFRITVWHSPNVRRNLAGGEWVEIGRLPEAPLTTVARKALHLVHNFPPRGPLLY
jgi:hypothetical protein